MGNISIWMALGVLRMHETTVTVYRRSALERPLLHASQSPFFIGLHSKTKSLLYSCKERSSITGTMNDSYEQTEASIEWIFP